MLQRAATAQETDLERRAMTIAGLLEPALILAYGRGRVAHRAGRTDAHHRDQPVGALKESHETYPTHHQFYIVHRAVRLGGVLGDAILPAATARHDRSSIRSTSVARSL